MCTLVFGQLTINFKIPIMSQFLANKRPALRSDYWHKIFVFWSSVCHILYSRLGYELWHYMHICYKNSVQIYSIRNIPFFLSLKNATIISSLGIIREHVSSNLQLCCNLTLAHVVSHGWSHYLAPLISPKLLHSTILDS